MTPTPTLTLALAPTLALTLALAPALTQVNSLHVLSDGVHVLSGDRHPATTPTLTLARTRHP